jgi:DNA-nicking Smr family endonuclease
MSRQKQERPRGGRQLRQDESELWTGITRSVRPLRRPLPKSDDGAKPLAGESVPAPAVSFRAVRVPRGDAARVAPSALPLAQISRRTKQKLARGTEPIDARIDLHGLTQSEAHDALIRFLRRAQSDQLRFVLVITGKGRARFDAERDSGVLRREVPRWLKLKEFSDYVLGYEAAHVGHGGEGALYVRLRKARS